MLGISVGVVIPHHGLLMGAALWDIIVQMVLIQLRVQLEPMEILQELQLKLLVVIPAHLAFSVPEEQLVTQAIGWSTFLLYHNKINNEFLLYHNKTVFFMLPQQ